MIEYRLRLLCRSIWLLLALWVHGANAQEAIVVDSAFRSALVVPAIQRDPSRVLTLDSILAAPYTGRWQQPAHRHFTLGADPANWWLHFRVWNADAAPRTVILRLNRKNFDAFQLFQAQPDGRRAALPALGAAAQNDPRYWLTDGFHVILTLAPGDNHFWAQASNRVGSMHLGLTLHGQEDFSQLLRQNMLLFGLFMGVMLLAVFFTGYFWLYSRDKLYLFYLLYILNIWLREAYNYSADFGILPVLQRHVTSLLIPVTFGLFYREFLQLWTLSRRWDWVLKTYMIVSAVLSLLIGVLAWQESGEILKVLFQIVDLGNLVFALLTVGITVSFFKQSRNARITLAAFLPLAAGFVAILLRNQNLIPNYPIITAAVMVGFVVEIIVFTLNFSWWYRQIETEKQTLALKLEVEEQAKIIAVQQAEQRVKDRIARDLHDDVAASLSGIRIMSQVARRQTEGMPTAELLGKINDDAQTTLDSIGDLIWAVKPSADYLNNMADRMREYASKVLEAKDIDYELDIPRDLPLVKLDIEAKRNIYLIFKETVNNAVKYSEAAEVRIQMRVTDHQLLLKISDNGRGFESGLMAAGNGLGNMQQRAGDIGGDLTIETAPGKGVQLELRVPLP